MKAVAIPVVSLNTQDISFSQGVTHPQTHDTVPVWREPWRLVPLGATLLYSDISISSSSRNLFLLAVSTPANPRTRRAGDIIEWAASFLQGDCDLKNTRVARCASLFSRRFVVLHTSLPSMFIYCRYKSIVTYLIALQITDVGVRNCCGLYFVLYSPYWKVFHMEAVDHEGIIVLYCVSFLLLREAVWADCRPNLGYMHMEPMPITVAARSKVWTGFESHPGHGVCKGKGKVVTVLN
jgi:hypothetical protein